MKRRNFIRQTTIGASSLVTIPSIVYGSSNSYRNTILENIYTPISQTKNPLAIAMWDFSWILRHHRYGEFENWDKVLKELVERGYNAIRIDAMPQFVAADTNGDIKTEFRSVKEDWNPAVWGNDYTMSFSARKALMEFLPKCEKYGVKVGLASWFLRHGTERQEIFMEEGGLLRAWDETIQFLQANNLLNNVIYVDILNEYPNWHGYDWLKKELDKRSDIKQFKMDNPDANLPDFDSIEEQGNPLKELFYNDFINTTLKSLKAKYPNLDFFASLDSAMELDRIDLSNFNALDYHVWFAHTGRIPGLDDIGSKNQSLDFRKVYANLNEYWDKNKDSLINWIDGRITDIAETASKNNLVCGNTEGWGPIVWYDHPELDWKWVKESAEICVDLALKHENYKFICTSNFTHPQFKGMWEDVKWHQMMTNKIKS